MIGLKGQETEVRSQKEDAGSALVALQNVSLRYTPDGAAVIEGMNLSIRPGEFVAVVGRSGCGKSSLLKLISGLHLPSVGEVLVKGERVKKPVGITGMAFQNASLLPWRNTLQNVLLPLEIVATKRRAYRRDKKTYIERAHALLETVGLKGYEKHHPRQLSGGMKQRVSLCRALIHEPELLLLDEPFGALDAFTREELWGVLENLWNTTGCTVVLITHDLTEAVLLSDTVYVMGMKPGRIVGQADITLARPRDLDLRFKESFVKTVADLRHAIGGT